LIALECYHLLELFSRKFDIGEINTWKLAHTAINMSLFPPLFFFSGLYYTDLQSLLVVLLSIHLSLLLVKNKQGWKLTALQMFLGIASLFFRQTNIFWVAVFPIGLIVLDCLQKAKLGSQRTRHEIRTDFQFESKS
jgi:alpha-1,2-glucosyltransferase